MILVRFLKILLETFSEIKHSLVPKMKFLFEIRNKNEYRTESEWFHICKQINFVLEWTEREREIKQLETFWENSINNES